MRAVGIPEEIRAGRRNYRNVNVHFAILNGLPAPAMRAQYAHAAHSALGAIVADRAVHAAFNVVDGTRIHQLDGSSLRRK